MSVKTVQAIINGQTHTLTLNNTTGKYEAQLTASELSSYTQPGHYYPATIKAEDQAGNTTTIDHTHATLGEAARLLVREITAPVSVITYPTASALIINNKPSIIWKVTDNDSGVNSETIGITIDSGSKITSGITKTAITGGYECSYTPTTALSDGSHTIKVDAADNDGNAATQKTVTFKIDTVPPVLSITTPANNLVTNHASCTVAGTTNDVTSSPCTVTIKLNNGTAEAVTVAADGAFSKALTLKEGENTITVVSTDSAGKYTTVTRTVTLDTIAPVITEISISPNPVTVGGTYTISVTVTD